MGGRAGLALVAAALLLLGAGCGSKSEAFRIGVLSDCYGPFSALNEAIIASAELPLLERGGEAARQTALGRHRAARRSRADRSSSRSAASPETTM